MSSLARWMPPAVDGPVVSHQRRRENLPQLEREAWDTGFAAGRDAGLQAALREQGALKTQLETQLLHIDNIARFMAQPLADLDASVYEAMAAVITAVVRQLIRREVKLQPEQIMAAVRDSVGLLPMSARDVRIHLHPADAALLREHMVEPASGRAWTVLEDPVITRGGCRISSENSSIDATIETRIGAAVAAALGEERAAPTERAP